jgi:hypothetical protein
MQQQPACPAIKASASAARGCCRRSCSPRYLSGEILPCYKGVVFNGDCDTVKEMRGKSSAQPGCLQRGRHGEGD